MQMRKAVQVMGLVTTLWLGVATPTRALKVVPPCPKLPDTADLVAIATPIGGRVVDAKAFLRRPGGDSIPVTAIEVRFQTVLGVRGLAWPDTFTLRYNLSRGVPEVPAEMRIGAAVMRWYSWRMAGDVFMGDPRCKEAVHSLEDFNPAATVQFLVRLRRSNEGHFTCPSCPGYCLTRLSKCYHRDMRVSAANRPLQPTAPHGGN
jgi:hypothetical protein